MLLFSCISRFDEEIREFINGEFEERRGVRDGVHNSATIGLATDLPFECKTYFFWCASSKWCEICLSGDISYECADQTNKHNVPFELVD